MFSLINADSLHDPFLLALSPRCLSMPISSINHIQNPREMLSTSLSLQIQVSWKNKPVLCIALLSDLIFTPAPLQSIVWNFIENALAQAACEYLNNTLLNSMDTLHYLSYWNFVEPWILYSLRFSPFLASMTLFLPCPPHHLSASSFSFSFGHSFAVHFLNLDVLEACIFFSFNLHSSWVILSMLKALATIYMLMIFKYTSLAQIFSPRFNL